MRDHRNPTQSLIMRSAASDVSAVQGSLHRAAREAGTRSEPPAARETDHRIGAVHSQVTGDGGKNSTGLKTGVVTITPEDAARWLEGNTHNRPVRQRDVDIIAADIKEGRWVLNGESIIFSTDGKLLDGQHRLWAVVETGIPIKSVVVFDAPSDAFTTIDGGRRRSPSDHLHTAGFKTTNNKIVAATASTVLRYRDGKDYADGRTDIDRVMKLLNNEPELIEWVRRTRYAPAGLVGFATPLAAVLHIGSNKLRDKAEEFIEAWLTGSNLAPGNPVLTLRNKVLSKPPKDRRERLVMVALAWNAFASGRSLAFIKTSSDMPRIKGE